MVRGRNIYYHTSSKSRFQSIFKTSDKIWMFITRENNMFVIIFHYVKQMKKFFLGFFFTREKLNIIHYQHIVFSIFLFKLVHFVCLNRVYIIINKFLASKIKYLF